MPTWMLVLAVAAAGLVGAGVGAGATAYFVERGPVGETGTQGEPGPRGPRGPSADDLSTEVADLAGRVDDIQVTVEDGIPPLVAEDIDALADGILEVQAEVEANCDDLDELFDSPNFGCSFSSLRLYSAP